MQGILFLIIIGQSTILIIVTFVLLLVSFSLFIVLWSEQLHQIILQYMYLVWQISCQY